MKNRVYYVLRNAEVFMVIDFLSYAKAKRSKEAALEAERVAELLSRERLEIILTDLLADLQAA
jgi:hypothetical protein